VISSASKATNTIKPRAKLEDVVCKNRIVSKSPNKRLVVRIEEATIGKTNLETIKDTIASTKSAKAMITKPVAFGLPGLQ